MEYGLKLAIRLEEIDGHYSFVGTVKVLMHNLIAIRLHILLQPIIKFMIALMNSYINSVYVLFIDACTHIGEKEKLLPFDYLDTKQLLISKDQNSSPLTFLADN
jgi:hypothetical protein